MSDLRQATLRLIEAAEQLAVQYRQLINNEHTYAEDPASQEVEYVEVMNAVSASRIALSKSNEPVAQAALEALDSMDDFARMANIDAVGPLKVLRDFIENAALAQLEQAEPVAWWTRTNGRIRLTTCPQDYFDNEWQPLYAAPPKRQPLTDKRIEALFKRHFPKTTMSRAWVNFARAVERAITGGDDGQ